MTVSFNLVDRAWITCLDRAGHTVLLSLSQLVTSAADVCLAEPDPLVEAAIWRLLGAICYAAGAYPGDMDDYTVQIRDGFAVTPVVSYLDSHRHHFDLFDPVIPFGQDTRLSSAIRTDSLRPALYLDITAAIDRPLHADTRHQVDPAPLTVGQALRALLVQNMWGLTGRTQGSIKNLPDPKATYGVAAPATGRVVVCPASATVAEGLAWRLAPTPDPGTPTWTYPDASGSGPKVLASETASLTWLSRRVLLVPDSAESVSGVIIARGQSYMDIKSGYSAGWSDVVLTPKSALSGYAITGSSDLLPIVAFFADARPGTLLSSVQTAASRLGYGPDLVGVSLVAARSKRKADITRRVPIPAAVWTTPDAIPAAAALLALRRASKPVSPATGAEEFRRWLRAPHPDGTELMYAVRDQLLAHVHARCSRYSPEDAYATFDVYRATRKAITTLPAPRHSNAGKDRMQEDDTASGPARKGRMQEDDTASGPARPDDFADLLGTTDTRAPRRSPSHPADLLLRRLRGYNRFRNNADTLAQLRRYARRPDESDGALNQTIRDVPLAHRPAAAITVSLWSISKSTARAGRGVPLPRLARSFGGARRGPADPSIARLIRLALATPLANLQPVLVDLVDQANRGSGVIDWRDLYSSMLEWDDAGGIARQRWNLLFQTSHSRAAIDQSLPARPAGEHDSPATMTALSSRMVSQ
jgi:hypothetical protein